MSRRKKASEVLGEVFITGFNGLELAEETRKFLSRAQIGGVLLFAHNYENPGQVAELSNEIQECQRELPLWISVDHEGGKVQRFRKGFTRIPEGAEIGATGSPKMAFEIAKLMGTELSTVGINLDFYPLADIATNPKNPVIGNRAFGTQEAIVSKFCSAAVRGLLAAGVQACVKHFPGHGDTSTDSHFTLPTVQTTLETLEKREFVPFLKAFKSGCNFVMTAHVMIPSVDPEHPATMSPFILKKLLREKLRYDRIIISDDLEMKAITDHFGAEDAPRMALEAGCDLLIYRTEGAAVLAYEALQKQLDSGDLDPNIVLEAANRIREIKKECLLPFHPVTVTELDTRLATAENQALLRRFSEQR